MSDAVDEPKESSALRPADWGERETAPAADRGTQNRSISVPPVARVLPSDFPTWETLPNVIPSKFSLSLRVLPSLLTVYPPGSRRASSLGASSLPSVPEEVDSRAPRENLFHPGEQVMATMGENSE